MIHLVCACGALVSAPPVPGSRTAACRACDRTLEMPDPAGLGLDSAPPPPVPAPIPANAPPVPAPIAAAPAAPSPAVPVFESDERLNLHLLEREAERLRFVGRLVVLGGLAAAGIAAAVPGRTVAERVVVGGAALFAAVAGWCGLRAARASCLAAVALAQRQREILRGMAKG